MLRRAKAAKCGQFPRKILGMVRESPSPGGQRTLRSDKC